MLTAHPITVAGVHDYGGAGELPSETEKV